MPRPSTPLVGHSPAGSPRPQARAQPATAGVHAPVNLKVITNLYRVKPDVVTELIDNFLTTAGERLATIREALEQADSTALRTAAHSLKGSSGTLGAAGMAAICGDLEAKGRDGALGSEASEAALQLEREFGDVRDAFKQQLAVWSAEGVTAPQGTQA